MVRTLVFIFFICSTTNVIAQNTDFKIEQLRNNWALYLQNKQLEKSIDLYADNAVFFEPNGSKVAGKKEITKLYRRVMKQFNSNIIFSSAGIHISGTIGYDSGDYNEELTDNNTHRKLFIKGSYLMVLQKQNTTWKITRLMWTQ